VVALKSYAAAEKFKDQLSRDFCGWQFSTFATLDIGQREWDVRFVPVSGHSPAMRFAVLFSGCWTPLGGTPRE
jgi:hypothetical protein